MVTPDIFGETWDIKLQRHKEYKAMLIRTYTVGRFLAGAAREKSSKTQKIHRKCVSPVDVSVVERGRD